jgi:predicted RNA-binding Zn-ribbon protein involved in translation (DUF1610 family)
VLDARNGILHVGLSPEPDAENVIGQVARAAELLLPKLTRTPADFWGNFHGAIMGRLDRRSTAISNRVADKLASSKERWEQLQSRLGESAAEALQHAAANVKLDEDQELLACPVCGTEGVASGSVEVQEEPEADHDGDYWYISGVSLIPIMHVDTFRCPVCGLYLEGEEELKVADIDTELHSDRTIDPRDYYGYDER